MAWFSGTCFSLGKGLGLVFVPLSLLFKVLDGGARVVLHCLAPGALCKVAQGGESPGAMAPGSSLCSKQNGHGEQPYHMRARTVSWAASILCHRRGGALGRDSVLSWVRDRRKQCKTRRVSSPRALLSLAVGTGAKRAAEVKECTV